MKINLNKNETLITIYPAAYKAPAENIYVAVQTPDAVITVYNNTTMAARRAIYRGNGTLRQTADKLYADLLADNE